MSSHPLQFLFIVLTYLLASAQEPDPTLVQPSGKYHHPAKELPKSKNSTVKDLGEGRYRLGKLLIESKKREIHVPVTLGVTDSSPLEYALVHSAGKTHESLLITDVSPEFLHIAALLLSAKENTPIDIVLSWKTHGPEKTIALAELISITRPDHKEKISWIYDAKLHSDGTLLANSELSLIALITDLSSLIHHQLPADQNNDEIYRINTKHRLPKKGLPMTLILKFPKDPKR